MDPWRTLDWCLSIYFSVLVFICFCLLFSVCLFVFIRSVFLSVLFLSVSREDAAFFSVSYVDPCFLHWKNIRDNFLYVLIHDFFFLCVSERPFICSSSFSITTRCVYLGCWLQSLVGKCVCVFMLDNVLDSDRSLDQGSGLWLDVWSSWRTSGHMINSLSLFTTHQVFKCLRKSWSIL